jgi:hypothetical protein
VNRSQAQQFEALKHGRYGGVAMSFVGGSHGEYHVVNYQVLIITPSILKYKAFNGSKFVLKYKAS